MGLATIDPHSHKVRADHALQIPKFGVDRSKSRQDTV